MDFQFAGGVTLVAAGALLILLLLPGVPETIGSLLKRPFRTSKWPRSTRVGVFTFGIIFLLTGILATFSESISTILLTPIQVIPATSLSPLSPLSPTTTPHLGTTTLPTTTATNVQVCNINPSEEITFTITDEQGQPVMSIAVPPGSIQSVSLPPGNYKFQLERATPIVTSTGQPIIVPMNGDFVIDEDKEITFTILDDEIRLLSHLKATTPTP